MSPVFLTLQTTIEICGNSEWEEEKGLEHWLAESGYFQIALGSSSRDIRITERLYCDFGKEEVSFHKFSLISDWISDPVAKPVLEECLDEMNQHVVEKIYLNDEFVRFWEDGPLIKILQMYGQTWLGDRSPDEVIEELISRVYERRINV